MSISQRKAVAIAVRTIIPTGTVKHDELSRTQKEQIHTLVEGMFTRGEVELKADDAGKPRSAEFIKKYVPGLVNNWVRKDKDLNGGTEYVAKNPGSRTPDDEKLRNMKNLLAVTTDPAARTKIQGFIDARLVELKPAAAPIDLELLPEELRAFVTKTA